MNHNDTTIVRSNGGRPDAGADGASQPVRLAMLGDIMLTGEWETAAGKGGLASAFQGLRACLRDDDLVLANLETTTDGGDGYIDKEPRVTANISTIGEALKIIGVDVVNLANNHVFDAYLSGFEAVRDLLVHSKIGFFGAGRDLAAASEPVIVERRGVRFGVLGYVSLETSPSHVATPADYGANPLLEERVFADVERLRRDVDHVIVSLHWGIEYCHVPSPDQVRIARGIIDHGASLVVGHHAHVVQGIEAYGQGVIAYNLGNVTTTDFRIGSRLAIKQTRRTKSSFVLRAEFTKDALRTVSWTPIRSNGSCILVDDDYARRRIAKANRLVTSGTSPMRWKTRRLVEDVVLRTAWKLDPRVIGSLRAKHVARFFYNLTASVQGRGPAA